MRLAFLLGFLCTLCLACDMVAPTNPYDMAAPRSVQAKSTIRGYVSLEPGSVAAGAEDDILRAIGVTLNPIALSEASQANVEENDDAALLNEVSLETEVVDTIPSDLEAQCGQHAVEADVPAQAKYLAFTLSGVLGGRIYRLLVEQASYRPKEEVVTFDLGASVRLCPIVLEMREDGEQDRGVIEGTVRLEGVSEHQDIRVEVPGRPHVAFTDAEGYFAIPVPPDITALRATYEGYLRHEWSIEEVRVDLGQTRTLDPVTLAAVPGRFRALIALPDGYDPALMGLPWTLGVRGGPDQSEEQRFVIDENGLVQGELAPGDWTIALRFFNGDDTCEADWALGPDGTVQMNIEANELTNLGTVVVKAAPEHRGKITGVARRAIGGMSGHGGIQIQVLGTPHTTDTTDGGQFAITLPAGGQPSVAFQAAGHDQVVLNLSDLGLSLCGPAADGVISVSLPDQTLIGRPGRISGRVRLVDDQGVELRSVELRQQVRVSARPAGAADAAAEVGIDANWRFDFGSLQPGEYTMEAYMARGGDQGGTLINDGWTVHTLIQPLDPGAQVQGVGFQIAARPEQSVVISGVAQRAGLAGNDAHRGIRVEVAGTAYAVSTAGDGRFRIEVPPSPSGYTLQFTAEGYETQAFTLSTVPSAADAAEEQIAETISLRAIPGRIYGQVVILDANGAPVTNSGDLYERAVLTVQAVDDDGQPLAGIDPFAVSDISSTGSFRHETLPAGRYVLTLSLDGYIGEERTFRLETNERIELGQLSARVAAEARFLMVGRALRSDVTDGDGHGGITVAVLGRSVSARTGPDGTFELALPPSEIAYVLQFSSEEYGTETVLGPSPFPPLDAVFGELVRIDDVSLSRAPGALSGRVSLPIGFSDSELFSQIAVCLVDLDQTAGLGTSDSPCTDQTAGTTRLAQLVYNGSTPIAAPYDFDSVSPAPGQYHLVVAAPGFVNQLVPVSIEAGRRTTVDLTLVAQVSQSSLVGFVRLEGRADDDYGDVLVSIEGAPESTTTRSDGWFSLPVRSGNSPLTIQFSKFGYGSQSVQAADGRVGRRAVEAGQDYFLVERVVGGFHLVTTSEDASLASLSPAALRAAVSSVELPANNGTMRGYVKMADDGFDDGEYLSQVVVILRNRDLAELERTNLTISRDEGSNDAGAGGAENSGVRVGVFDFDVAPGQYVVEVELAGFASQTRSPVILPGEEKALGTIFLSQSEVRAEVRGEARIDQCLILGEDDGQPICDYGGIQVEAVGTPYVTTTNVAGAFYLDVAVGDYFLRFSKPGYEPETTAEIVTARSGPPVFATDVPTVLAARKGEVRGAVVFPAEFSGGDLTALRNASQVRLIRDDPGQEVVSTVVPTGGHFSFTGVPVGDYLVTVELSGFFGTPSALTLSPGEVHYVGQLDLQTLTTTLVGQVKLQGVSGDSGHGGVSVFLLDSPFQATTSDNGQFSMQILPGEQTLRFVRAGFQVKTLTIRDTVLSTENDLADVADQALNAGVFELPYLPTQLTGAVERRLPSGGTASVPGVGISVRLEGEEDAVTGNADGQGRFAFNGIQGGPSQIVVSLPGYVTHRVQQFFEPGSDAELPTIVLELEGGQLSGIARRQDGVTSGGVTVLATRRGDEKVIGAFAISQLTAVASDTYQFDHLPVGTWDVVAFADGYQPSASREVTMTHNGAQTLAFELVPRRYGIEVSAVTNVADITVNTVKDADITHYRAWFGSEEPAEWNTFGGEQFDLTLPVQGQNQLRVRMATTAFAESSGGQTAFQTPVLSRVITLDTQRPSLAVTPLLQGGAQEVDGRMYARVGEAFNVDLFAVDTAPSSGISSLYVGKSIDTLLPVDYAPRLTLNDVAPGDNAYYFRVVDGAGNESEIVTLGTLRGDTAAPTIDGFSTERNVSPNTAVRLTLNISDVDSADESWPLFYRLYPEGNAPGPWTRYVQSEINVALQDGVDATVSGFERVVTLEVKDAAGRPADASRNLSFMVDRVVSPIETIEFATSPSAGRDAKPLFENQSNSIPEGPDGYLVNATVGLQTFGEDVTVSLRTGPFESQEVGRCTVEADAQNCQIAEIQLGTQTAGDREWTLNDGTRTFVAVAVDGVGNESAMKSLSFVVDNSQPILSSLTVEGDAVRTTRSGTFVTSETGVPVAVGCSDFLTPQGQLSLQVMVGNFVAYDGVYQEQVTVDLPGDDGLRVLSVTCTDLAGNESHASLRFKRDVTPPEIESLSLSDGGTVSPTNDLAVKAALSLALDPSGSGRPVLQDPGIEAFALFESGATDCASATYFLPSDGQAVQILEHTLSPGDGSRQLYLCVRDEAGNVSARYESDAIVLDTTAPEKAKLMLADGASATNEAIIPVTIVSNEANLAARFTDGVDKAYLNGQAIDPGTPFALNTPPDTVRLGGGRGLSNGLQTVALVLIDAAGNISDEAVVQIRFDNEEPVFGPDDIVVNRGEENTANPVIPLRLNVIGADTMQFWEMANERDGCVPRSCDHAGYGPYSSDDTFTVSNTAGKKHLCYQFCDQYGNASATGSQSVTYLFERPRPTLSMISPTRHAAFSRAADAEYDVIMKGAGIASDTEVVIGGLRVPCTFTEPLGSCDVSDQTGCANECHISVPDLLMKNPGVYLAYLFTPDPVVGAQNESAERVSFNVISPYPEILSLSAHGLTLATDDNGNPEAKDVEFEVETRFVADNATFRVGRNSCAIISQAPGESDHVTRYTLRVNTAGLSTISGVDDTLEITNPSPGGGVAIRPFGINPEALFCSGGETCVGDLRYTRSDIQSPRPHGAEQRFDLLAANISGGFAWQGGTAGRLMGETGDVDFRIRSEWSGGALPFLAGGLDHFVAEDEREQGPMVHIRDDLDAPRSRGSGEFVLHGTRNISEGDATDVALGDLDGDGDLDAVVSLSDLNTIEVYRNVMGYFYRDQRWGTGLQPLKVALGDLNGDGVLDIVSANAGADSVSILFGYGDRTMAERLDLPMGAGPTAIEIADVSGDGLPDLVTANCRFGKLAGGAHTCFTANGQLGGGGGTVGLRLGDGLGGFGPYEELPVHHLPTDINVTDVDGDGRLDVVALGALDAVGFIKGRVQWLRNTGDAVFEAPQTISNLDNSDAWYLTSADFDGNGTVDFAISSHKLNRVPTVAFTDGRGELSAFDTPNGSGNERTAGETAVADLNGDGWPDLVVANDAKAVDEFHADGFSLYFGSADGSLTAGVSPSVNKFGGASVAIGDITGDGVLDVVTVHRPFFGSDANNAHGSALTTARGVPGDSLGGTIPLSSGAKVLSTAVGDANGDGHLDLFATTDGTNHLTYWLGTESGLNPEAGTNLIVENTELRYLAMGDLNDDGRSDLAVLDFNEDLHVWYGISGAVVPLFGPVTYNNVVGRLGDIVMVDQNRDGKDDIILTDGNIGAIVVIPTDNDGLPDPAASVTFEIGCADGDIDCTPTEPSGIATGFFNLGANVDLLVHDNGRWDPVNFTQTPQVTRLLGNTGTTFYGETVYTTAGNTAVVAVGDFDGDGQQDMLTGHATPSQHTLHPFLSTDDVIGLALRLGTGNGLFESGDDQLYDLGVRETVYDLSVADFNGDDIDDIAVTLSVSNALRIIYGPLSDQSGTLGERQWRGTASVDLKMGKFPYVLSAGDFDGNGSQDVVMGHFRDAQMKTWYSGTPGRWLQEIPLDFEAAQAGSVTGRLTLSRRYVERAGVAFTVRTEVDNTINAALLSPGGTRVDVLNDYALAAGLARRVILPQDGLPPAEDLADLEGWHQKGEWRLVVEASGPVTVDSMTLLMSAWFQR